MDLTLTHATALARIVQRERELDAYRQAVERYLGQWVANAQEEGHERFFSHVERCFDWGVTAPSCARTWLASSR